MWISRIEHIGSRLQFYKIIHVRVINTTHLKFIHIKQVTWVVDLQGRLFMPTTAVVQNKNTEYPTFIDFEFCSVPYINFLEESISAFRLRLSFTVWKIISQQHQIFKLLWKDTQHRHRISAMHCINTECRWYLVFYLWIFYHLHDENTEYPGSHWRAEALPVALTRPNMFQSRHVLVLF